MHLVNDDNMAKPFAIIIAAGPANTVRHATSLAHVERAVRCLNAIDLRVRPIDHRTADHVRGHTLLCRLAYDVHAWAPPLVFEDEALARDRQTREPRAVRNKPRAVRNKKVQRSGPTAGGTGMCSQ
jgi:hypothetical protein